MHYNKDTAMELLIHMFWLSATTEKKNYRELF